jgi:hypothetical protein
VASFATTALRLPLVLVAPALLIGESHVIMRLMREFGPKSGKSPRIK